MNEELDKIKMGLLAEVDEDYVGLWQLIASLERVFPDKNDDEIMNLTLSLATELLQAGLVAGHGIYREGAFIRWDSSIQDTIERIKNEWQKLDRKPTIDDIVWFVAKD